MVKRHERSKEMDDAERAKIEAVIREVVRKEDKEGLNPKTGEPYRHGEYFDPEPPAFDFIKRNREQAREERILEDYIKGKYRD